MSEQGASELLLERTVAAFNVRRYAEAARIAEQACQAAQGRDEAFWLGIVEVCRGYDLLMGSKLAMAEKSLVASMEKLRNFGFRHQNLEITSTLASVRRAVEEIREVRQKHKKSFDLSLLPTLKMAAKADD